MESARGQPKSSREARWSRCTSKGKDGYLLITQAGNEAVLAVMASARAKLGIIFLDVRRAAGEVEKIV